MTCFLRAFLLLPLLLLVAAGCGDGDATKRSSGASTKGSAVARDGGSPERASSAPPKVALHKVGSFDRPVLAIGVPGTDQVAVVEQPGRIRVVSNMTCAARDNCPAEVVKTGVTVLDLTGKVSSGNEQGLLGLAFAPGWPDDPRIFIDYTDLDGATHVEAWKLSTPTAKATRLNTLFEIEQPYANHNGGNLAFGPDGNLYIGMGDGGDGGDPGDRAQTTDELLGKLLRVSVDTDDPTGYVATGGLTGRPEVWALGLRNPWRFSFDADTGDLWIGDVGQDSFEEIDAIAAAQLESGPHPNFGWRRREGFAGFDDSGKTGPGTLTAPVLDYGRDDGCSVTGGIVYRGKQLPALDGFYVFADFCSDQLRFLRADGVPGSKQQRGSLSYTEQAGVPQVNSFGRINDDELLVTTTDGGV
ncbi:MAG: glucose/sorbosone dehydrogenase-like protein, partial [Thermoleophilia bacterium]|nr:glucose/sorbosone dehydrogenase-like protein [Thermoleophilia bacterium]